jgi:predicted glycosyltransferase involved in capsule biosynthesis
MQCTKESKIVNVADAKEFFSHLVYERQVAFHPDDRFEDYMSEDGIIRSPRKSVTFIIDSWTTVLMYAKRMVSTYTPWDWKL